MGIGEVHKVDFLESVMQTMAKGYLPPAEWYDTVSVLCLSNPSEPPKSRV